MRRHETDVVVIGAGFAGLSAAGRLVDGGLDVLVLETRDRVGGRAFTGRIGDGLALDFGGQWVGPTQDAILALPDRLDAPTFRTYDDGRSILDRVRTMSRYRGTIPRLSPAGGLTWPRRLDPAGEVTAEPAAPAPARER
jgi:monoamine oxidase